MVIRKWLLIFMNNMQYIQNTKYNNNFDIGEFVQIPCDSKFD